MRRHVFFGAALWAAMGIISSGYGNSFYANTDQLGYTGTVQNITQSTAPVATSTPRDADIYVVNNVPSYDSNYSIASTNWYETAAGNQNDSLFQLYDGGQSATGESGTWDPTHTIFTMNLTGANAPYNFPASASRFWQPDQGDAWGVTFLNYTLTLTATFDTPAGLTGNLLVSQGNLLSMTGNFSGQFQSTADVNKNPITNGDIYAFNISMSNSLFNTNQAGADPLADYGYGVQNSSEFAAIVPLPSAAWGGLALIGGLGLVSGTRRMRRRAV